MTTPTIAVGIRPTVQESVISERSCSGCKHLLPLLCVLAVTTIDGSNAEVPPGQKAPASAPVHAQTGGVPARPAAPAATAHAALTDAAESASAHGYDDAEFLTTTVISGGAGPDFADCALLFLPELREQSNREKREELRGIVEKLVNLRDDFNSKIYDIVDAQARQNFSTSSKMKASIYLQAAESLANEIEEHVSSSEYFVLGLENHWDSDFQQARMYYQKSVLASNRDSSVVNKSMARRTLAASYFVHEPQDIVTGRRYFEEALAVLEGGITTDFYSIYTKVLTCREWSGQEAWFGSKESAQERLSDAMRYVMMLPDWYPLKAEEIRLIANGWRGLGNSYFQTAQGVAVVNPDWGGARAAYQNALDVLQALRDENSVDLCGQIRQDWAYNEMLCGSRAAGEQQIASAVECYRSLSDEYPRRAAKLKALEDMAAALEQRLAQPPPTDERGPPAARRGLEPRVAYEPTSLARESILPTLGPTVPAPERRG